MGRAPCCDKANVKRGPWSPEEDAKLKSYIETHGTGGNWIALPQKIGLKRCGKSCRLRWLNYLRPNIKHGGFTEDEDNLICSLYISIGSRWSIIAAQLPGRTDNDIKNYWNTRLKKKLLGRQRTTTTTRSEQTYKKLDTKRGGGHDQHQQGYSVNDYCFNVYPQPPLLPPYSTLEAPSCDQDSNSFTNIPIIPTGFPQPNHFGDFSSYTSDQNLSRNSAIDHYLVPSTTFNYSDVYSARGLGDNLSGADMFFNSSSTCAALADAAVNCPLYPSAAELCLQRKTPQDWTYFDEPRLLQLEFQEQQL